jgi:hypothetical protein
VTTYVLEVGDDNKAQVDFWESDAQVRAFIGGIGSGKTFAGALEVLRMPPGSRGMVVAPTYKMLRDATMATFLEVCPPDFIAEHNKSEHRMVLGNGVEILWRSADNPETLRGPNLGWAWGDEWAFVSEEAHKVLVGRLRRDPARLWMTTTPDGMNWLHNWCVTRDLGYQVFNGRTADNTHNAPGYYESLLAQYEDDPEFAAQELEGSWVDLGQSRRFPPMLVDAVCEPRAAIEHSIPSVFWDGGQHTAPAHLVDVYAPPAPGRVYVFGADPAEGVRGGDDSSMVLLDLTTGEVALVLCGELEPKRQFPGAIAAIARHYNDAQGVVERNNHGHAVIAGLEALGVVVMPGRDGRAGWQTTEGAKADAANTTYSALLAAREAGIKPFAKGSKLVRQLKSIERATLAAPGKRKGKTKIDDVSTAYQMAELARAQGHDVDWIYRMTGMRR